MFDAERDLFSLAERSELSFDRERIPVFRFGSGPAVLLLHGWAGSSGQLHAFVRPLLEQGRSVVTFDAPAHGEATGTWLAVPRYAECILAVASAHGPLDAVIAHSMGAAAAAYATSIGLNAGRFVFIGPPASELDMFRTWAGTLGFDERLVELTKQRVEERVGIPFERLAAQPMAATVRSPLLVIHDRDDREVPWADGAALAEAAPDGRLLTTEGLGHRRILRDANVVRASVSFAMRGELHSESVASEASKPARV